MKAKKVSLLLIVLMICFMMLGDGIFAQEKTKDSIIISQGSQVGEVENLEGTETLTPEERITEDNVNLDDNSIKTMSFNEPIIEGDWEYIIDDNYNTNEAWETACVRPKGNAIVTKYLGNAKEITIPSKLGGKQVIMLDSGLFGNNKNIEKVVIPEGVIDISSGVFYNCTNLKEIILPSTLKYIEQMAFYNCVSLTNLTIPKSVCLIYHDAFSCGNKGVQLSNLNINFEGPMIRYGKNANAAYLQDNHVDVKMTIDYDASKRVVELVNQDRSESTNYRAPLKISKELTELGMLRAIECMLYFDHESPTGLDIKQSTLDYSASENIAIGGFFKNHIKTAEDLQDSLVHSGGHHGTMRGSKIKTIGVGYATFEDTAVVTQEFGKPETSPSTDEEIPSGTVEKIASVYYSPSFFDLHSEFHDANVNDNSPSAVSSGSYQSVNEITVNPGESKNMELAVYTTTGREEMESHGGMRRVNRRVNAKATWVSSNPDVAEVDANGKITAKKEGTAEITATTGTVSNTLPITVTNNSIEQKTPATQPQNNDKETQIAYRTHVQNIGWQPFVTNGTMAGTSGRSLRLEGMNIKLVNQKYPGDILYRTHIQNIGWENNYKKNGAMSGTEGRSLRLEAMEVTLNGEMANHYDVYYRVHAQNLGWMTWAKNGESAGTAGHSYRLEGMQIVLVEKGQAPPSMIPPVTYNARFKQK